MKEYKIAVVGMGAVGHEMLKILEQSIIPISDIVPLASRDNGRTVDFRGKTYAVNIVRPGIFKDIDIVLIAAGGEASKIISPQAVKEGAVVIDNSNAFRMEPNVPLVIPEVNPEAAKEHKGLISNPNCSTIQMLVALKPLHDMFKIKRIVVSTYQAVSGSGLKAIEELKKQSKAVIVGEKVEANIYPHQIAFNALPHIDDFLDNGYTKEEMKMLNETRKIFNDNEIQVCPTAVRVPVMNCHSESINIETEKPLPEATKIMEILNSSPGVKVLDDPRNNVYPLAFDCSGADEVFVGRIRKDFTITNGLNLWVVGDNLRKGAALNAVQIAELLYKKGWIKKG
ncbi:MAG: aspartate-semialdehyde dehydrogenase [Clostridia bacterium]|nr:aspartate-semialdehyde dehydrogenase [Clostridia bacterium]